MKGLQRCAVAVRTVLTALHRGQHHRAVAQVVQNLKAKLQCALADGDWGQAWSLTGPPYPLAPRSFAGDEQEMAAVAGYMNARHDLKAKTRLRRCTTPPPLNLAGGGAEGRPAGGQGRGRGGRRQGGGAEAVSAAPQ